MSRRGGYDLLPQDAGQLSPGNTVSSAFTNQGQIDWVTLSKTTISTTVGFLSRLSNAGVDPFTVAVGQTLASRFKPSKLGQHRLDLALHNLKCLSALDNALWFGFGIKNIIRSLAQTEEGASCLMLCAALSETHSARISARILSELTRLYTTADTTELTPSLRQWWSLVDVCSGTLAQTPFGHVVEQIMALAGDTWTVVEDKTGFERCAGQPKDIAKALKAVGDISRGHVKGFTLVGGAECGWVAAFAYWFFDVPIEIRNKDGKLVHSSGPATDRKIVVLYSPSLGADLQLMGETYLIGDVERDMLRREGQAAVVLSGRVRWDAALHETFGRSAVELLKMKRDFGTAIGSAARIFQALVRAEEAEGLELPEFETWCAYHDSSYGRGFLNHINSQFPETAPLRNFMDAAMDTSCASAIAAYEVAFSRLSAVCTCNSCRETRPGLDSTLPMCCLPLLSEAIIRIAWQLSMCHFDADLLPSRTGLEEVYNYHAGLPSNAVNWRDGAGIQPLVSNMEQQITLCQAALIFTGCLPDEESGRRPSEIPDDNGCAAIVVKGLCLYLGVLLSFSDDAATLTRIHIIPGRIEVRSGRSFKSLAAEDAQVSARPMFDYTAAEPVRTAVSDDSVGIGLPTVSYETALMVEEQIHGISVLFHITSSRGSAYIPPATLVKAVVHSTGLVNCTRKDCAPPSALTLAVPIYLVDGDGKVKLEACGGLDDVLIWRRTSRSEIARCLALCVEVEQRTIAETFSQYLPGRGERGRTSPALVPSSSRHHAILRRNQCQSCTIRAAVRLGSGAETVYVVS